MANYLPVLLVSVSTNAVPDDSSVSTLPRGQVDYLSHEWQEEDVWKSWRNMTRQKNEIANGVRLENASWRTWWKQRNKLKTISPETLNWLKDSDVTWLYGPLHTAVEWTPPPKPKPDPTAVGKDNSAHDRLDLSLPDPHYKKPILKHRSISELLTSDLPSPLFSPAESESEGEDEDEAPLDAIAEEDEESATAPRRPALMHTKSDTHVVRWGGNRAFRKDSPPRIAPAGHTPAPHPQHPHPTSAANLNSYFAHYPPTPQYPHVNGGDDGHPTAKKRHITFNTFVEQCIAIEKPKKSPGAGSPVGVPCWNGNTKAVKLGAYQDDDDEDDDDGAYEPDRAAWNDSAISSDTDEYDDEDDEDDDVLEMRTSSSATRRSKSKASSSSSSSNSTASSRQQSRSRVRPPLIRTPSGGEPLHVTIAPIAPTILKTTGVGNGWSEPHVSDDDDEYDGAHRWLGAGEGRKGGRGRTPVELVYVPPLGSNYSMQHDEDEDEDEEVYHHREAYFSVGDEVPAVGGVGVEVTPPSPTQSAAAVEPIRASSPLILHATPPGDAEPNPYDYFGGPDLGEDFARSGRTGRPASARHDSYRDTDDVRTDDVDDVAAVRPATRNKTYGTTDGPVLHSSGPPSPEPRSRSRSRSRSRTPSPALAAAAAGSTPVAVPVRTGSFDRTALLSPPQRGRTPSNDVLRETRGRSASRGSSGFSDRERGGSSPSLGSLSPEGGSGALAYVRARGRGRGREGGGSVSPEGPVGTVRAGRGVGFAASAAASGSGSVASSSAATSVSASTSGSGSGSGSGSSASSGKTAMPHAEPTILTPAPEEHADRAEEEAQRSRHPTPANSPVRRFSAPTGTKPVLVPASATLPSPAPPYTDATRACAVTSAAPIVVADAEREEPSIVGRAVGMMSSAGAFLGLWNGGGGGP